MIYKCVPYMIFVLGAVGMWCALRPALDAPKKAGVIDTFRRVDPIAVIVAVIAPAVIADIVLFSYWGV